MPATRDIAVNVTDKIPCSHRGFILVVGVRGEKQTVIEIIYQGVVLEGKKKTIKGEREYQRLYVCMQFLGQKGLSEVIFLRRQM